MYNRMPDSPVRENRENYNPMGTPTPTVNPALQPTIQPANPVQQTIYIQTGSPAGNTQYNLSTRAFFGLGITQIVAGIICILMYIVSTVFHAIAHIIGTGVWCPILFIIAGAFSIAAARRKTMCTTVACMVLSIIAATSTTVLFSFSVLTAVFGAEYDYQYGRHPPRSHDMIIMVAGSISAIMSVLEAVVAIVTASLCCRAVCCGRLRGDQAMVAYVPNQGGQFLGPVMIVQNPAMAAGTSLQTGGASGPPQQEQAGELPPKTPPPGYEDNFHGMPPNSV